MNQNQLDHEEHHNNHNHDIHHDHHDHHHSPHHPLPPSRDELITRSIESLLLEKGIVTKDALDRIVEHFENEVGPMYGARVVAKAWVDADFKKRLLENGSEAIKELGYSVFQSEHLFIKENTSHIHNLVVCTLCSCYPWAMLGLPPTWYKSFAYRSRVVIDPRGVLKEFGLELGESVSIRVWDSNAEIRYLVLPERPEGTEHMTEEELAAIVSRDAMIGVVKLPAIQ